MNVDERELINAIKKDNVKLLQKIFESKDVTKFSFSTNLIIYDPVLQDKPPIISVAAFFGAANCLNYLIKSGVSLTTLDNQSRSIQYFSVAGGNIEIIKILSSSFLDFTEFTHLAAGLGNLSILKFLINELKCDPTTKDALGCTLLHNVAIGGDTKTADWLIKSNFIDINSRDQLGIFFLFFFLNNTPLHLAAFHGNLNIIKLLLKVPGIDLNPTNYVFKKLNS